MSEPTSGQVRFRYRTVALPVEHGGWGFLLEPLLAGLLIAPSWAGLTLAVAALAAFLLHQPLKVALKDRLGGRSYTRTGWAWRFAAVYGAVALVCFGLTLAQAGVGFTLPLLVAIPMAAVQIGYEARNRGRELTPELLGALALAATAPAILIAGGAPAEAAWLLWALLGLRIVTSLLYVRTRIRRLRGKMAARWPAVLVHAVALLVAIVLAAGGAVSAWVAVALAALLGRAAFGLWQQDGGVRAKTIGLHELVYGVGYALIVGATMGV